MTIYCQNLISCQSDEHTSGQNNFSFHTCCVLHGRAVCLLLILITVVVTPLEFGRTNYKRNDTPFVTNVNTAYALHGETDIDSNLVPRTIHSNVTRTALEWVNVSVPILPLVTPFSGATNAHTDEPIFYDPAKGYSFPKNGQGGQVNNKFYPASVLYFKLAPGLVFGKVEAVRCIKNSWIHIDGDSLARDVYYDLTELYGMSWNDKKKLHKNTGASYMDGTRITFGFDPTKKPYETIPSWVGKFGGNKCPDVWVYSTGLWDIPRGTPMDIYEKRMMYIADFVANSSCMLRHKVLRFTTPYQDERKHTANPVIRQYNRIARMYLAPIGFKIVDTFQILENRSDLSHDGVHYTGPGSKWVTNTILNEICFQPANGI
eukprot:275840_1